MMNPFEINTGSDRAKSPGYLLMLFGITIVSALLISKLGLTIGFGLLILPFVFVYLYVLFLHPVIGMYTALVVGFVMIGLSRYVDFQVGLLMDGILMLTLVALIFNKFYEGIDWTPAKKDITVLTLLWFGYSIFELVNPEVRSMAASINGIRGTAIYMLLIIPMALLLFDTNKKLEIFFLIWGAMSVLASMKGIMQNVIGVDRFEQAWLDAGASDTHVLFGKLRIFSFMSDAGQFGANQGYSAVVMAILSLVEKTWWKKWFYTGVAILGLYGLLISGTRGAISVPLAGFGTYFILRKNKVVMLSGFVMLLVIFGFFKFTVIGQGNDSIRRMRSAFDPNDPSFQVRLENQKKLSAYLASRPFGGGIGHAGVKAQKYLPYAFLSNVATDSWYVLIWAEMGVIGLLLHLFTLFYVVIKAANKIWYRIRDPIAKMRMMAMTSGMVGVMVASYGNAVLGTFPTGAMIYISMALLVDFERFDTPEEAEPKLINAV